MSAPIKYTREQMVRLLGGFFAFLGAEPVAAQMNQMARPASRQPGLRLVLDGMSPAIEVVYRGERLVVTADEVMSALRSK